MVTVQSSQERTRLLARGGFGVKPPKGGWTELIVGQNELKVVKANHGGVAVIEFRSLGGADGCPLIIEQCEERRFLRNGTRCTLTVAEGATVFLRSSAMRSPDGRPIAQGHVAGPGDGWSGVFAG